jgi:hypothetical protein
MSSNIAGTVFNVERSDPTRLCLGRRLRSEPGDLKLENGYTCKQAVKK